MNNTTHTNFPGRGDPKEFPCRYGNDCRRPRAVCHFHHPDEAVQQHRLQEAQREDVLLWTAIKRIHAADYAAAEARDAEARAARAADYACQLEAQREDVLLWTAIQRIHATDYAAAEARDAEARAARVAEARAARVADYAAAEARAAEARVAEIRERQRKEQRCKFPGCGFFAGADGFCSQCSEQADAMAAAMYGDWQDVEAAEVADMAEAHDQAAAPVHGGFLRQRRGGYGGAPPGPRGAAMLPNGIGGWRRC